MKYLSPFLLMPLSTSNLPLPTCVCLQRKTMPITEILRNPHCRACDTLCQTDKLFRIVYLPTEAKKIQLWWKWRILHLSRGRSVSISKSSHGHSAAYLQLSVMGWNADAQALVSRKNECHAWVLSRSSRGKSPPFLPPSSGIACMGSQSDPAHSGCRPCCERLHVKE